MVSGPSGVGKTSVVDGVVDRLSIHVSVSATTRAPRPGEVEGEDYFFVDEDEFRRRVDAGEMLEWAEYNHNLYGTPGDAVKARLAAGSDVLLEIEVQGARRIRAAHPEAVLIFISPPSLAELEARLRGRGDTGEADIARRIAIAAEEMAAAPDLFDHIVVNDRLDAAIDRVVGILRSSQEVQSR